MLDSATTSDALGSPSKRKANGDDVLVQQAQAGDLNAFDELVRRYQTRIYATLYHMTSNHEDADDLTQESFIKAYKALRTFKGDASFYTWVYRIAVNKTINFLKRRRRRGAQMSLNEIALNADIHGEILETISVKTPLHDLNLAELQKKLNESMQKLSDVHRLVVTLHDIQGVSHEEISRIMDCNTGTVRSRLFYARQQLQAYLSEYLKPA